MLSIFLAVEEVEIWVKHDSTDLKSYSISPCASGRSPELARIMGGLPQFVAEHLAGYSYLKRLEVSIFSDLVTLQWLMSQSSKGHNYWPHLPRDNIVWFDVRLTRR